jgi:hypothetical protein
MVTQITQASHRRQGSASAHAICPSTPGALYGLTGLYRDLWQRQDTLRLTHMRDRDTIDSELRLLALRRQSIREHGGEPSSQQVDDLLDERLGHRAAPPEPKAAPDRTSQVTPRRRKSALRRFGPLAVLPLSLLGLVAAGVAFVFMFGRYQPQAAESPEPADAPPPASSQPNPPAPQAQAPPVDIADRVFIDVLKQDGLPVPSHEYVTTHGRAVCDFLAHQPNFNDAVRYVQQSSIWDANQSANFTAGAVVSYCPQYEPASTAMLPPFQNSLSNLQAIQRDMQGIQGGLQNIRDHLPDFPGQ